MTLTAHRKILGPCGLMAAMAMTAITAIAPSCGGGTCSTIGCTNGANLQADLPSDDWATIRSWNLTVCRNQTCISDTFQRLPVDPSDGVGFQSPSPPAPPASPTKPWVQVLVNQPLGRLNIQWEEDWSVTLKNGDTYSLDVLDASGASVISFRKTVNYMRLAPNGEACGPICHLVDVSATP